jgi:hypothetical protein
MRKRKRHIEIFSVSALDLFASALGAFILVSIILFPYYLKDQAATEQLETAKANLVQRQTDDQAQLDAKNQAIQVLQSKLDAEASSVATLRAQLDEARAAIGEPFLLVGIRWATAGADIDLHVTDPAGHEFYWFKNNAGRRDYPSSPAELSYDMTNGPAVELWQDAQALPGLYRVDYVANALPNGQTVEVFGTVFDRNGRHDLPARILRSTKERVRGGVISVEADGHVALR